MTTLLLFALLGSACFGFLKNKIVDIEKSENNPIVLLLSLLISIVVKSSAFIGLIYSAMRVYQILL